MRLLRRTSNRPMPIESVRGPPICPTEPGYCSFHGRGGCFDRVLMAGCHCRRERNVIALFISPDAALGVGAMSYSPAAPERIVSAMQVRQSPVAEGFRRPESQPIRIATCAVGMAPSASIPDGGAFALRIFNRCTVPRVVSTRALARQTRAARRSAYLAPALRPARSRGPPRTRQSDCESRCCQT